MTEQQLRQKVVSIMQGWLGCKESDGSHRKIIDLYNSHLPRARGYKVTYKDAWCATAVSAAFIKAGLTDIAPTECSCHYMIELYKKKGRWQENDGYKPKIGDVIMYDWDDTGKGDCTGAPEHVGIVAEISGNNMRIIEGNIKDSVGYRSMVVNDKFIRGYCLPNYASKVTTTTSKPAASNTTTTVIKPEPARSFDQTIARSYKVTASNLNLRVGPNTTRKIIKVLENGDVVTCYGYYTKNGLTTWLLVKCDDGTTGYCSKKYLK